MAQYLPSGKWQQWIRNEVHNTRNVLVAVAVQSSSRVQLCNPVNCSMPGSPVLQQLLKFALDAVESSPNHPPPWSVEKLSSRKPVLGAKSVGDHCFRDCSWVAQQQ